MIGSAAGTLPAKPTPRVAFGRLMRTVALGEAARQIYIDAKDEALPIAVVAEREAAPDSLTTWFANSILQLVPVYRIVDGSYVRADTGNPRETIIGLISRLDLGVDDLYVRRRDVRAYLRWARTLQ